MEKTSLSIYLSEIAKNPLLDKEEEQKLAKLVQTGTQAETDAAAKKLIESNLKLVCVIAREYENFGIQTLDLIAEGNTGLMEAANRFKPGYDSRFSTYAAYWIRLRIQRALMQQSREIRLPVYLVEKHLKAKRVIKALTGELGREPTTKEIMKATGLDEATLDSIRHSETTCISLETPIGDNGSTIADFLSAEAECSPDTAYDAKAKQEEVELVFNKLTAKEQEILVKRYGLKNEQRQTLSQIGEDLKVTRERIRQIERQALKKLYYGLKAKNSVQEAKSIEKSPNIHL